MIGIASGCWTPFDDRQILSEKLSSMVQQLEHRIDNLSLAIMINSKSDFTHSCFNHPDSTRTIEETLSGIDCCNSTGDALRGIKHAAELFQSSCDNIPGAPNIILYVMNAGEKDASQISEPLSFDGLGSFEEYEDIKRNKKILDIKGISLVIVHSADIEFRHLKEEGLPNGRQFVFSKYEDFPSDGILSTMMNENLICQGTILLIFI